MKLPSPARVPTPQILKKSAIVALYSRHAGALTFENLTLPCTDHGWAGQSSGKEPTGAKMIPSEGTMIKNIAATIPLGNISILYSVSRNSSSHHGMNFSRCARITWSRAGPSASRRCRFPMKLPSLSMTLAPSKWMLRSLPR
jgi:hypothetical protein